MLWIVGAKGLVGSALCARCLSIPHIKTGHEVDIGDLNALSQFAKQHRTIDYIINCAAFSLVDEAESKRETAYSANALGPQHLSQLAQEIGAKFIHLSTDYVFSGETKYPYKETDTPAPCNYYGQTKWEGEQKLSSHDLVIRTSWVFGGEGKNFVSKLLQLLFTQKEIRLVNDQWSRPTYAPDLADAILKLKDESGLYQFANQGVASKYDFGLKMWQEAKDLGFPVVTQSVSPVSAASFATAAKRPIYTPFDTTKIEKQLPIRHWHLALREFLCAQLPASL